MAIEKAGIEPKAFLLNGLAFYQAQITAELARGADADLAKLQECYAFGREFAKDAAPYCHSRLQSIEHAGPAGGPVEMEFTFKLDNASSQFGSDD